jgi:hypothetical protein
VAPLGDDLFGDEVSLYNGSTTFTQVDMALPGNSALPVELRRTFSISPQGLLPENIGAMANWDVAVPHIHGEFGPAGWVAGDGTNLRCSKTTAPPGSGYFNTDELWSGNRLFPARRRQQDHDGRSQRKASGANCAWHLAVDHTRQLSNRLFSLDSQWLRR